MHLLNEDGMVACNPRDREAAHRAEVEAIASEDPAAVTCRKCRVILWSTGERDYTRQNTANGVGVIRHAPQKLE